MHTGTSLDTMWQPIVAADGGRPYVELAALVCLSCKNRKKKCDKTLPCCGYCVRKGLSCVYEEVKPRNRVSSALAFDTTQPVATAHFIPLRPILSEAELYSEVHHLVRATGHFVDDVSVRYFQGFHRYFPFVSRTRFHSNLITARATPSAGSSILLLAICLVAWCPPKDASNPLPTDRRSLYLITRSFFAQVQALFPPSLHLIQAGILLAVYEYARGRPDVAFASIESCVRMAYTAGIHHNSQPNAKLSKADYATDRDVDFRLKAEEDNTWWGIIICERIISCDVTFHEQPLVTTIPNAAVPLPTEPEVLELNHTPSSESALPVSISCLNSVDVGAFGRSAQAAWILDQVLKTFDVPSLDTKLLKLHELDIELQRFLSMLVHPCYNGKGVLCETIAISIRALFTLHWHILSQPPQTLNSRYGSLEDWHDRSDAALDTATKMVVDIVENNYNNNMESYSFDDVAPSYTYIIRASLAHVCRRTQTGEKVDNWLRSAKDRLRVALEQFNHRWDLDSPRIA